MTVSDRIRVRSQPRVSDDSIKYEPLLPTGTELFVIEGPIEASGYAWYHVAPTTLTLSNAVNDGWVAVADRDGTPWIALKADPLAGLEFVRSSVARAAGTVADATKGARSINAFALDLYPLLLTEAAGRNLVFSPTSIALALAMARAGARGSTAASMDAVLHSTGSPALSTTLNALEQELVGHNTTWTDEGGTTHALSLRIANAAFGQRGYPIEQAYLDAIAQAFGAPLGLVDYATSPEAARLVINAWVSRQTAGRIPSLLDPGAVTDMTRLILVNAVYLKANWELEFDPTLTTDRWFTPLHGSRSKVPTMVLSGGRSVPYASGSGWQATELRYLGADGSPLAMTLIEPGDLGAFEAQLTSGKLGAIVDKLDAQRRRLDVVSQSDSPDSCGTYPYTVQLYMPRFGINFAANVLPELETLGMQGADFSGITNPSGFAISSVIHQANIDVDETGTEAAAATAIGMDIIGCLPGPVKTITLRLNHPFLFMIRDVKTGAILFMGRVVDPSQR